ncbi:MAG TPA: dienelactone hydrolase family protein [Gemmataceae bacterium]|nr:dienelactone hydrolase family protein [Gemmataceae bacterium]
MRAIAGLLILAVASSAGAAVKTKDIEYEHDGIKLKGVLAYDDAATGKRPGVLVFHEWWGLNDYAKMRAQQLAESGYVAFAADMYGAGKVTDHPKEAGKMAQEVRMNRDVWQGRAQAALKVLQGQENVDKEHIAAIGYCFGGSTALILAASGAPIKAVSTFHAALPPLTADDAKKIQARLLINNGADDSFVSKDSIEAFRKALDAAGVKYLFENHPGAVHSFTVKEADKHEIKGMAYNEAADKKSWQAMQTLFKDTLGK